MKRRVAFSGHPWRRAIAGGVAAYVTRTITVMLGAATILLGLLCGAESMRPRNIRAEAGTPVGVVLGHHGLAALPRFRPRSEGSAMSPVSSPLPDTAEPGADALVCLHCDQPIRPCDGGSPLGQWKGTDRTVGCRFGRYVHADGKRPGSHLCGTGANFAEPATCSGGVG